MKKFLLFILLSGPVRAELLGLSNPADMAGQRGWGVHSAAHYLMATDYTAAKGYNGNWNGAYMPRNGTNLALGTANQFIL